MAVTLKGRELTTRHRKTQNLLAAHVSQTAFNRLSMIDPKDIRGTITPWVEDMVKLSLLTYQQGTQQAQRYVTGFREAEWGSSVRGLPVVLPKYDPKQAVNDVIWAPRLAQKAINYGVSPTEAWMEASAHLMGSVWCKALEPGRDTIRLSAEASGSSWRRVTQGNPCAWCAMLVTRGPVYSSMDTALKPQSRRATGDHRIHPDKYHNFCGCTVEEFRGDWGDWVPTAQEQKYIDAYDQAWTPGATGKEVAQRMRASGSGLFHDSPTPQTQAGGASGGSGGGRPPTVLGGVDDNPAWRFNPGPDGDEDWPKAIPYVHDGKLGRVKDAKQPPSWDVIKTRIQHPNDKQQVKRWDAVESATAAWMELIGIDLVPVMRSEELSLPDSADQVKEKPWEFKNNSSLNPVTLERHVLKGIEQSSQIVFARVDGSVIVGMTETQARELMSYILGLAGEHFDHVIIVLDGGDYLDYQSR